MAFVVLAGGRAFWEIYSAGGRCRCRTQLRRAPATWTAWQIVIPAAIVLLAIGARARDRRLIAVALGIAGLSLVRQIPLGARVTPLPMVGGGLIILYLLRDRRPRAISVAISACVALVVSATLLAARTPEDRRNRSFGAIVVDNVRAPGQVLRPLTTGGDAEMAPALVAALTVVPKETGYRYGFAIVGDLFSRPIPRSVWPGRPAPLGKP